ncbi:hypothetical protein BH09PSE4_BH09PSE4_01470 [soil metagenome]
MRGFGDAYRGAHLTPFGTILTTYIPYLFGPCFVKKR